MAMADDTNLSTPEQQAASTLYRRNKTLLGRLGLALLVGFGGSSGIEAKAYEHNTQRPSARTEQEKDEEFLTDYNDEHTKRTVLGVYGEMIQSYHLWHKHWSKNGVGQTLEDIFNGQIISNKRMAETKYSDKTDAIRYQESLKAKKLFDKEGIEGLQRKFDRLNAENEQKVEGISLFHLNYMTAKQLKKHTTVLSLFFEEITNQKENRGKPITEESVKEGGEQWMDHYIKYDPEGYALLKKLTPEAVTIFQNEGAEGLTKKHREFIDVYAEKACTLSLKDPKAEKDLTEIGHSKDFIVKTLNLPEITPEAIIHLKEKIIDRHLSNNLHHASFHQAAAAAHIAPQVIEIYQEKGKEGLVQAYNDCQRLEEGNRSRNGPLNHLHNNRQYEGIKPTTPHYNPSEIEGKIRQDIENRAKALEALKELKEKMELEKLLRHDGIKPEKQIPPVPMPTVPGGIIKRGPDIA